MASSSGTKGAGDRESREAAALRANLARRKDQKRARRGAVPSRTIADETSLKGPSTAADGQVPGPQGRVSEGEGRP